MKKSYLISFEGIECAGKSTQIKLFQQFLTERGFECAVLREPGATTFGEKVRDILLSEENLISPEAELLLFLSSRAQLLTELVLPRLQKDRSVVILDRYIDSSLAYQGGGRKLGVEKILKIHEDYPPLNILPDMTFLLDLPIEKSRERLKSREKDRMEQESEDFFQEVFQTYQEIQKRFSKRIKKVNADQSIQDVHRDITNHWNQLIS